MEPLLENAFRKTSAIPTTPSAALRRLRGFFLMPQPPLLTQEGSCITKGYVKYLDAGSTSRSFPDRSLHNLRQRANKSRVAVQRRNTFEILDTRFGRDFLIKDVQFIERFDVLRNETDRDHQHIVDSVFT